MAHQAQERLDLLRQFVKQSEIIFGLSVRRQSRPLDPADLARWAEAMQTARSLRKELRPLAEEIADDMGDVCLVSSAFEPEDPEDPNRSSIEQHREANKRLWRTIERWKREAAEQQKATEQPKRDDLDDYIPAKDCRTVAIDSRDKLDAVIDKEGLRVKHRGRHKYIHAADWHKYRQRAERPVQAILDDPACAEMIEEMVERQSALAAEKKRTPR